MYCTKLHIPNNFFFHYSNLHLETFTILAKDCTEMAVLKVAFCPSATLKNSSQELGIELSSNSRTHYFVQLHNMVGLARAKTEVGKKVGKTIKGTTAYSLFPYS